MADSSALLASVFQTVTKSLLENQQALNQADDHNHDHGDNMVSTFETITKSLQSKKSAPDAAALAFAAKQLSKKGSGGSSKLYAQGLAQAAQQFKGKQVDPSSALQLLQTLIGAGQAQPSASRSTSGDMLGALLGGLTGGGTGSQGPAASPDSGLDAGDLLNAGMAFLQSRQGGGSNAEALLQALAAGSGMGQSNHRTQSTELVINAFTQALGALSKRR